MVAPTLLDYAESNWTDTNTSETTDDLDWSGAGDRIVVLGATEDNGTTLATPTGTGITLAAMTGSPTNTGSSCKGYAWSATASGNGNTVLTSSNGSSGARGISAWAYSGSDGLGTPVINVGTGLTVSVTVAADSSVVMVLADWNATTDVDITTVPSGGTIRQNNVVSGLATFLVIEWTNQAAGTRSYGVSNWTGTGTVTKIAVEVQGTTGGPIVGNVNTVTENNTAQAISRLKALVFGQVTTTDTARPVTSSKVKPLGSVTVTSSARRLGVPFGRVTETNTSRSITWTKAKSVNQVTSTNVGLSVTKAKNKTLGLITSTQSALAITWTKSKAIGLVSQTSQALAITRAGGLGVVIENNVAQAIASSKARALGIVSQSNSSLAIGRYKSKALGIVATTGLARPVDKSKRMLIGLISSTNAALAVTSTKVRLIGIVSQGNTVQAVTLGVDTLGIVTQVSYALQITWSGAVPIVPDVTVSPEAIIVVRTASVSITITTPPAIVSRTSLGDIDVDS